MILESAKWNLKRAYLAFYGAQGWPFADEAIAKMRQELSALAANLDADDPAQAKVLSDIIAVSDQLRMAERHCKEAERKLSDALVSIVVYESTIKQL